MADMAMMRFKEPTLFQMKSAVSGKNMRDVRSAIVKLFSAEISVKSPRQLFLLKMYIFTGSKYKEH